MEAVKQWAFAVCTTMIVCGIAIQLLPKSNLESLLKLVISVFFLSSLLSPFLFDIDLKLDLKPTYERSIDSKAQDLSNVLTKQTENQAAKNIQTILENKLANMGINYDSVTININTNGQSTISADIILDESHRIDHEKIAKQLENEYQIDVRLGYIEKGEKNA